MAVQDHGDYISRGLFNGLIWTFAGLAIAAVAIRIYCRACKTHFRPSEDTLIIFAVLFLVAATVERQFQNNYVEDEYQRWTDGRQPSDVSAWADGVSRSIDWNDRHTRLRATFHATCLCLAKCSVIAFYLRLARTRRDRILLHSIIGFIVATTLWYTLTTWLSLRPIAAAWRPTDQQAHSVIPAKVTETLYQTLQLSLDLLIMFLPISYIRSISLPFSKKVGITLIYTTAIISLIASALALRSIVRLNFPSPSITTTLHLTPQSALLTAIEASATLIATAMLAMSPLIVSLSLHHRLTNPIPSSSIPPTTNDHETAQRRRRFWPLFRSSRVVQEETYIKRIKCPNCGVRVKVSLPRLPGSVPQIDIDLEAAIDDVKEADSNHFFPPPVWSEWGKERERQSWYGGSYRAASTSNHGTAYYEDHYF